MAKKSWRKVKKDRRNKENEFKKQRAERGFSDCDVWNIYDWFIEVFPKMLRQLKSNHMGFVPLDENGHRIFPENFDSESDKVYNQRWETALERMAFLLDEMDEDKCSMKNPYYDAWWKAEEAYAEKYGYNGEKLKTTEVIEEEKRRGGIVHWGMEHDPENGEKNKELSRAMLEYDRKISEYRDKCKDEFMDLFKEYFWDLWD